MNRQPSKSLTNQYLAEKFTSQFDMVNSAIKVVEQMIKGGYSSAGHDAENPVVEVLGLISEGRGTLEDIEAIVSKRAQTLRERKENSRAAAGEIIEMTTNHVEVKKSRRMAASE